MISSVLIRCSYLVLISSTLLISACRKASPENNMPPPEVSVIKLAPSSVTVTSELPGRLEAQYSAEIQARVAGIILKRHFAEGSHVKTGDLLYQIDPAPFAANVAAAQAALERSQAYALTADQKFSRYQNLLTSQAISAQEYDDAVATNKQAQADVAAAQATLTKAKLELSYTKVTAPISGQIGRAFVTEGALVGQTGATPLALIQATHPMYVRFQQSALEAARIKQAIQQGQLKNADKKNAVTLILDNGDIYPHPGKLLFTDITVEPSTGMVTLRAEFPNPQQILLPGTFVRVHLNEGANTKALLVPQQAVTRNAQGASVFTIGENNKVAIRPIKLGMAYGNQWLVIDGLNPGDQVIVEGLQKIMPGQPVKPVPYQPDTPQATSIPFTQPIALTNTVVSLAVIAKPFKTHNNNNTHAWEA